MDTHNFHKSPARPYLHDTEFILWQGRPFATILPNRYDLLIMPVSAIWLLGIMLLEGSWLMRGNVATWQHIVTVISLFIGLHGLFGRLILRYFAWRGTLYVLTNRRLMIMGGQLSAKPRTLPLADVVDTKVHQHPMHLQSISFKTADGKLLSFHSLTDTSELMEMLRRMTSYMRPVSEPIQIDRHELNHKRRDFLQNHYTT